MSTIQRQPDYEHWMMGVKEEIATANDPLCKSIKTVFEGKVSQIVLDTITAYVSETEKMEAAILLNPLVCLEYCLPESTLVPRTPQFYGRLANSLLEQKQKNSYDDWMGIVRQFVLYFSPPINFHNFTAEDLVPLIVIFLEYNGSINDVLNPLDMIEDKISSREFYLSLSSSDLLRLFKAYFSKQKIVVVFSSTILNAAKTLMPLSAMLAEIIHRHELSTFTLQFLVTVAHDFSQALGPYPEVQSLLDPVMQQINNHVTLSGLTMNDIALLAKSTSLQKGQGIQNIVAKIVAEINNRANSSAYTHKQFQELMTSLEDCPANRQIVAIRQAISQAIKKQELTLENLRI